MQFFFFLQPSSLFYSRGNLSPSIISFALFCIWMPSHPSLSQLEFVQENASGCLATALGQSAFRFEGHHLGHSSTEKGLILEFVLPTLHRPFLFMIRFSLSISFFFNLHLSHVSPSSHSLISSLHIIDLPGCLGSSGTATTGGLSLVLGTIAGGCSRSGSLDMDRVVKVLKSRIPRPTHRTN